MRLLKGIALLAVILAGCGNDLTVEEAKVEARQRWHRARAQVLYGVGLESFKVGQVDRARNKANEALALAPSYLPARTLLGKTCLEKGEYDRAVQELRTVYQSAPNSAEATYLLAVAHEKNGQLEEALDGYRRAYALDGTDLSPVKAAAEVLVAMGRVREAQLQVESYLAEAGPDPAFYELAGRLAMMQGEHESAARYYEHARDLDYDNVLYHEALARAWFFAEQHREALSCLTELTERKDYDPPAWVYTMLGDCNIALGRPYHARDAYLQATSLTPEDPGAWTNVAKAALILGDEDRAILSSRHALGLDPGRLDATLTLGYALLRSGQEVRAVRVLSEARSKHPQSATLLCLLGRAYSRLGHHEQARACYDVALRLEPDDPLARELAAAGELSRAQ